MALNREHFVTTSGSTVGIQHLEDFAPRNRDAVASSFEVSTPSLTSHRVNVVFGQPPLIERALRDSVNQEFDEDLRHTLGATAILDAAEQNPEFLTAGSSQPEEIFVNAETATAFFETGRALSDQELRRFIARRAYQTFLHHSLRAPFSLDEVDQLVTGARLTDFRRNLELLLDEDYLEPVADGVAQRGGPVRATAILVREVEAYGSARADAVTQENYAARLDGYEALSDRRRAFLDERQRYEIAGTPEELHSVFRALAPMVEDLTRDLLRADGSGKEYESLGPMIGDLRERSIGSRTLWDRLNHVLKFPRDLAGHGHELSAPVLRIACENAFDLAPMLAAQFPTE